MCTVTWCRQASGYELFFNRDELRRRVAGRPPEADDQRRYLAPEDPEAGGSWLAVNTAGTTIGILNAHPPAAASQPAQPMQEATSRGQVVRALEHFRAGRSLRVLDLNGVTSEATHIYDPAFRLLDTYRVLSCQWRLAFEIGAANQRLGAAVSPLRQLISLLRKELLSAEPTAPVSAASLEIP